MKPLLIISHTPSENTISLAEAAYAGALAYAEGRPIQRMRPTEIEAEMILGAAGIIIGTTENISAMAGLTKDMFDRCYDAWLDNSAGLPVGIYIRAGLDGTATNRQLTAISGALNWKLIQPPVILHGTWQDQFTSEVETLAGAMAAGLDAGIFG